MRKSLILVLPVLGAGAGYAAGVTRVGADPNVSDPSTWRWQVSSILADQGATRARPIAYGVVDAETFDQHYERYTPLGVPERKQGDAR